jgi:hypothetical protein
MTGVVQTRRPFANGGASASSIAASSHNSK